MGPKQSEPRGGQSELEERRQDIPKQSEPQANESGDSGKESEVLIDLQGTVTLEKEVTPIQLQLKGYFAKLLTAKKPSAKSTDKRRVKPNFYGEALTTDDVYQRLEKEEKEKEEKKKALMQRKDKRARNKAKATSSGVRVWRKRTQKKTKAAPKTPQVSDCDCSDMSEEDTGVCEQCGAVYADADDSEAVKKKWMGCDNCSRWYHYDCLGLTSIPTGYWSCDLC